MTQIDQGEIISRFDTIDDEGLSEPPTDAVGRVVYFEVDGEPHTYLELWPENLKCFNAADLKGARTILKAKVVDEGDLYDLIDDEGYACSECRSVDCPSLEDEDEGCSSESHPIEMQEDFWLLPKKTT